MSSLKVKRELYQIHTTKHILNDLDRHIKDRQPFSTIRFGDAVYGMLSSYLCPDVMPKNTKWKNPAGKRMTNSIMGLLTIPKDKRNGILKRVAQAADNANYCDSYDSFYLFLPESSIGYIGRRWKEIHEGCGITNESYCSCYLHYFSIVDGELNLFDIMKGRKIFCITNQAKILDELKRKSNAELIDFYQIPRRGRKGKHFLDHYSKIMKLIKLNAKHYDLFLIGAGLLGKIYCDEVRRCGGRAFDSGRLFDFWGGSRGAIKGKPKRFLKLNKSKMLCERIKNAGNGVW